MADIQARENVMSNQVIKFISLPLEKIHIHLPSWLSIIAFELLTIFASSALWVLAKIQPKPNLVSYLWASWGALLAGIIVVLVEWNL